MRDVLFFLFYLVLSYDGVSQSYSVGHRQITFTDADRQGRQVLTELYYPSTIAGDDVPIAGKPGTRFPLLVFGHGFVMEWSAYANFWSTLVPQGYVLAFARTESGLSPDHQTFGQDLAFLVSAIQGEGENMDSPFFSRVDSTSCVMGHSMGGGSSFLAIQYNPSITAIVNFAAAETNPSAISACSLVTIPALLFAGANDCITPAVSNQQLMYDSLGSACKAIVTITGASHCQFAEQNVLCSFGELTCSPSPAISRAEQHRLVDTLLVPWLDYQLKGNCHASAQFQSILYSSKLWTAQQACEPCFPVRVGAIDQEPLFQVFPIPAIGDFYLKGPAGIRPKTVRIFNLNGVAVYQQELENPSDDQWQINARLPPGVYSVVVNYDDRAATMKLIIH
jgi:pimeloyl-ACP methyl ester carboxylesterase